MLLLFLNVCSVIVIVKGRAVVVLNDEEKTVSEGDVVEIGVGEKHTCRAIEDTVILEFAFGECEESDIVRIRDKYRWS